MNFVQPALNTPLLRLRPFAPEDAERIRLLAGAWAVADTTLLMPHPYPEGAAEQHIASQREKWERRESAAFAMIEKSSSLLCGAISLQLDFHHSRGHLGYWVGVPYWGKGYATEAVRAILAFAFETLGLHRVWAERFARNPASGRVMQKAGMQREGQFRQHVRKGSQFEDLECYGILRTEWESLRRNSP